MTYRQNDVDYCTHIRTKRLIIIILDRAFFSLSGYGRTFGRINSLCNCYHSSAGSFSIRVGNLRVTTDLNYPCHDCSFLYLHPAYIDYYYYYYIIIIIIREFIKRFRRLKALYNLKENLRKCT